MMKRNKRRILLYRVSSSVLPLYSVFICFWLPGKGKGWIDQRNASALLALYAARSSRSSLLYYHLSLCPLDLISMNCFSLSQRFPEQITLLNLHLALPSPLALNPQTKIHILRHLEMMMMLRGFEDGICRRRIERGLLFVFEKFVVANL